MKPHLLSAITTRHAMWREANMKSNQFWAAVSKALAVMTLTLIMASVLAPGASGRTRQPDPGSAPRVIQRSPEP